MKLNPSNLLNSRGDEDKASYILSWGDDTRAKEDTKISRSRSALLNYLNGPLDSIEEYELWLFSTGETDSSGSNTFVKSEIIEPVTKFFAGKILMVDSIPGEIGFDG